MDMRILNIAAVFLTIASAFLLYGLNYETRRLEARLQHKERAAAQAKSDIAVLKAERGHLSRPDRIDALAQRLGLRPARTDQLVAPDVASLSETVVYSHSRVAEGE